MSTFNTSVSVWDGSQWVSFCSTVGLLQPAPAAVNIWDGSAFVNAIDNTISIWDGTQWVGVACLTGPGGGGPGGGPGGGIGSPNTPSNVNVANISGSIGVTWNDNSSNEDNFEVWRSVNGGSYALRSTRSANTTSYVDSGVSSGNTYRYRVRATNSNGDSSFATSPSITI